MQTEAFSGPFDLLMHLIVRDEVDLYEVSLSAIVDAYLGEMAKMQEVELELATEFLMIAATLVELKSRRLLPDHDRFDLDDELALWEERDLLLARLLECKTFKDAALELERMAMVAGRSFPRTAGLEPAFLDLVPDPLERVTPDDLLVAYRRATAPRPVPRVDLGHVTPIRLTVAEVVEELLADLPDRGRLTFRQLTGQLVGRIDVVVHFLAVLELYKQGMIELGQETQFGDISIVWTGGAYDAEVALASIDTYEG